MKSERTVRPDATATAASQLARRMVRWRWVILGALCLAYFLTFFSRFAVAVIVPDLMDAFAIGAAELGLLGAAYFWTYALMQPPAGMLADSIGPRRAVTVFMAVAGVGTLLFALAPSYPLAFAGRALGGVGVAVVYLCGTKVISRWFREDEFSPVIGLFVAVGNLGGLAAAAPLAMLLALSGWRGSFLMVAALTAVVAALCWLGVRDDPREVGLPTPAEMDGRPPAGDGAAMSLRAGIGEVLCNRNIWLLGIYAFLNMGSLAAMQGLWTVPYLRDVYHLPKLEASNMLTMWALGLTIGGPIWGYLADKVFRTRRKVVLGGLLLYIVPWVALVVWPAGLPPWLFYGMFLWAGTTNGSWVPVYGQLKSTVPPAVAATAMGMLNFCFFTGGAVYQTLTGLILAAYGKVDGAFPVQAYQTMFAVCLAGLLIGVVTVHFSHEERLG